MKEYLLKEGFYNRYSNTFNSVELTEKNSLYNGSFLFNRRNLTFPSNCKIFPVLETDISSSANSVFIDIYTAKLPKTKKLLFHKEKIIRYFMVCNNKCYITSGISLRMLCNFSQSESDVPEEVATKFKTSGLFSAKLFHSSML